MGGFKKIHICFLAVLLLLFIACSSDDNQNDFDPIENDGEITFIVSGAINIEKSGQSTFYYVMGDYWEINGFDGFENSTFNLLLKNNDNNIDGNREVGNYSIGGINDEVVGTLRLYEDGEFIEMYSSIHGSGATGELEVTYSSETKSEGNFSFKAFLSSDESEEVIIEGHFSATPSPLIN
ncbi:MAG TPA: hypothetical protein VK021_10900 [Flavobacteriaceae bacterium]|nr:hypothetical protein [Flavobacteriaceae bacterium]